MINCSADSDVFDLNYLALILAIFKRCTVEQAFKWLNTGKKPFKCYTANDYIDMVKLKKLMTYTQLSEVYGITVTAAVQAVRRGEKLIKGRRCKYVNRIVF